MVLMLEDWLIIVVAEGGEVVELGVVGKALIFLIRVKGCDALLPNLSH